MHTERLHSFLLPSMITPRVSDIVGIANVLAPLRFAEEWDNAGLQVGDPASPADRIMVALDADRAAIEEAVALGCRLLITHHPMIFRPLRKISTADHQGALLHLAIRSNLAVISLHTNFDTAQGGVNDLLAERLGVVGCVPLKISENGKLIKLSVFVPVGHEERVMDALFACSGSIGNYRDCSFSSKGTGTFRPMEGANPFLGEIGRREYAEESRIEVLLRKEDLSQALKALIAAHPYEEPAYDLYPLLNRGKPVGMGRVGGIPEPISLDDFARHVKDRLGVRTVRYVGGGERKVRRVALCGGSGASLVREASVKGADVLVTGDVRYHDAREAEALGIALVDAGHFATELPMVAGLKEILDRELSRRGFEAVVTAFEGEREPFSYI